MHIKVIGGMDMYRKGISIEGNVINNSIGYCHYKEHKGELNKELVKQKNCIHLEKYSEKAFEQKAKYYNKSGKNKRCRKHRTKL